MGNTNFSAIDESPNVDSWWKRGRREENGQPILEEQISQPLRWKPVSRPLVKAWRLKLWNTFNRIHRYVIVYEVSNVGITKDEVSTESAIQN